MPDSLLNPTVIAEDGLIQLENNVVLGANVYLDYVDEFVKVGNSITIRKPVQFTRTSGATRASQDISEGSLTFTIDKRFHVSWELFTQDLTLTVEKYSERYVTPGGITLGNGVDVDLAALYKDLYWSAGTPGTTPDTFAVLGDAAAMLDEAAVPDDGQRKTLFDSRARWKMADALKGLYHPSIPDDYVRRGLLGNLANMDIFGDQNVARHATGALVGDTAVKVDGASQNQAYSTTADTGTLHLDGFSADTASGIKAGDQFTIANVYAVNPVSKVSTGQLQRFTVTSDFTPSSNEGDLTIRPRIITSGAYQTVDSVPADDAAVTWIGDASTVYPQNLAFHRNALGLVMVPLNLPRSASFKARADRNGMSVRVIEDYDSVTDEEIVRMDVLYGVKAIDPRLGGRIWG